MIKRIGFDSNGNEYTFRTGGEYFEPNCDTKPLFDKWFDEVKYCVLFTILRHDKGERPGLTETIKYDNGIIGYQCIGLYENKEDAEAYMKEIKEKTPSNGLMAYVDIWLSEKK